MIISLIVILAALLWLLVETNWLTIRLPTYAPEPKIVIQLPDMQEVFGQLNAHGILALAGIIGPLVLVAMDLIASFADPKYNIIHQSMSSLVLTSKGWLETIGFLIMGLMIESFTAGLYLNIKRRRGFGFGTALLAFFGFGILILGIFRTNPPGLPATFSSYVHRFAAYSVLGLFPIALALMLPSIKNDRRWQGMFSYTIITIVLAQGMVMFHPFLPVGNRFFGLYERIIVLNAIIWLVTFAVRLLIISLQHRETGERNLG